MERSLCVGVLFLNYPREESLRPVSGKTPMQLTRIRSVVIFVRIVECTVGDAKLSFSYETLSSETSNVWIFLFADWENPMQIVPFMGLNRFDLTSWTCV